MTTKTKDPVLTIKNTIREIVDDKFSSIIENELGGSDFIERLQDNLPEDFVVEIVGMKCENFVDTKKYNDLLDNITEILYSDLIFG